MHRSRDELVEALQRAKIDRDSEAKRAQDIQEREPINAAEALSRGPRLARRASLDRLKAQAASRYQGDLFGTHGPYPEGLLYLTRRRALAEATLGTESAADAAAARKKRHLLLHRSTASVSEDNDVGAWRGSCCAGA
jgi:hypothetical protein